MAVLFERSVSLDIPGRPVAKERTRARNGQFYTPARTRHYEEAVAWAARAVKTKDLSGPLHVEISLRTRRPLRGDVDNYAKSILDGLVKGGLISDDREIQSLCIGKDRAIANENDCVFVSVSWYEGSEAPAADS